MSRALRLIREQSQPNDVTIIYWAGRSATENGERYLLTRDSGRDGPLSKSAVRLADVLGVGHCGAGARVVLLDVAGQSQIEELPRECGPTAVIRYGWAREDVPVAGVLTALEGAQGSGGTVLLKDVAVAAGERAEKLGAPVVPKLLQNLEKVPSLANLVIKRKGEQ